ncbi:hypothetical protein PybrP1_007159 [[Pythium] brassicae (nom. inval.)]|nr:hypothetical protein PybrP1_007159 [[Pythium] brassicae (nom. inval.)]
MESQRMGIAAAHDGGMNRLTTHATRMRRRPESAGYSANSKGSAPARKTDDGRAGPLQTHLLRSAKSAAQGLDMRATAKSGTGEPSDAWALFAHADRTDYWLMAGGILASVVSGASLPSINIVFANAVTALANRDFPDSNGVDMAGITSCALDLLGIGAWVLTAEFLSVALLTHSAARQTRVMRAAVLKALVFQDMTYFDTSNPFSLSADIGGNMVVVQEGLGRKLGQFAKHSTQVVLAVTVGIARGWNVGLGLAATFPVFLLAIYLFVAHVSKSTHLEADEYSSAGAVAEEALSAVGTVLALNAQPGMTARYEGFLVGGDRPYRTFAKVIASAIAVIQFASFVLFGYGLWLGGHLVANRNTVVPTMKDALPAIMVEIAGLLAIGSAAPALEALASARAAAVAVLQLERQRPAIDCRATRGRELDVVRGRLATTLVIAHRLETIAAADVVFVVEDGKIAERGPYAQLAGDPTSRYHALFGGDDGDKAAEQARLTQMHRGNAFAASRVRGDASRRGGDAGALSLLRASAAVRPSYVDEPIGAPTPRRRRPRHDSGFIDSSRALDVSRAFDSSRAGAESLGFFVVKDSLASNRPSDIAWLEATRSTVGVLDDKEAGLPSPDAQQGPDTAPDAPAPADTGLVRKILALMAVDKRFLTLAMGASLVNGLTNPLAAILRSNIVNDMYAIEAKRDFDGMRATADMYLALFLGVGACLGLSYFVQSYNFRLLGRNLTNRMRSLTFASMLKQDMKWFDAPGHSAGALSTMLSNDTAAVKIIAGEIQGRKVQNLVVIAFATALAFAVGSWQSTLVFLGVVPFIVATVIVDQRTAWYAEEAGDRSLATAGRLANEIVHNAQTITEHNLQERVLAAYERSLDLPTRVAIKTGYSTGLALGVGQFVKWVGYAALHYFGAGFILSGATTFALFYRTMNLMNVAALCIDETATFLGDEKGARVAAARIFALIEHQPDVDLDAPGETLPDSFSGDLNIAGVGFAYPLYPDAPVLADWSLRVRGGATTVLRGGSDAGKSTLLSLLLRLYDATDGSIAVGGTPIQRLDVRWLRSKVALVHQEPVLFRLSVLDNLRLGRPAARRSDWATERGCTILAVDGSDEAARAADTVAVVARGAVLESGSHNELLRLPGGVYAAATKRKSSPMTEL